MHNVTIIIFWSSEITLLLYCSENFMVLFITKSRPILPNEHNEKPVANTINIYTLLLVFPWKLKYYNLAKEKPIVKSSFLLIQLVNY